jgi:hypothetical protein
VSLPLMLFNKYFLCIFVFPVFVACPSQLIFLNYLKITSFEKDCESKIIFTLIAKHVCHTSVIKYTFDVRSSQGSEYQL